MSTIDELDTRLQSELTRVGGGYLKIASRGAPEKCRLFVHEGSELGVTPRGTVYWHPWEGAHFSKTDLLQVLEAWPTFGAQKLDDRVGIWFDEYRRQRHRRSGELRWKETGVGDAFYPDIFRWDDLEQLSA